MITATEMAEVPLLQSLSAAARRQVAQTGVLRRIEKEAFLFRQDQPAEAAWLIREGWVHLVSTPVGQDPAGGVVVATITPEEGLCGLSALDQGRYSVSAVAATACEALRLPAALFRELLRHEPRFAIATLRVCARRLRHMAEQYAEVARPVPQRVVAALLRLQRQFGAAVPLTHRELAQIACTTTESAIRVVRRLKAQGYVAGQRGLLRIEQPAALERLLQPHPNGHRHEEAS